MAAEHLDFLLNLDAKMDGLEKGTAALHEAEQALKKADGAARGANGRFVGAGAASGAAAAAHGKHAHSAMNLGHAFEGASSRVHGLLEAMGLIVVFEGLEKVAEKILEIGAEILTAAGNAERFEKSFSIVLGAEGSEELLSWIEKIAQHTEFTDDKLKGVAAELVQVGLKGDSLKRAMGGAIDIAAMPGGNLEAAIGAMARLKRTGKADNRALAPLGLGEQDFLGALSKRTGTPSEQLKKDLEKGKVNTTVAMEALFDLIHAKTGKALGAAGVDMSTGLQARMTHLKDLPEQFFQALSKSPAFARLSDKLGGLLKLLSPDGEVGGKLAKSLELLFTRAVDFVTGVDFEKVAATVLDFFEKLPGRLEAAGEVLSVFASIFKTVAWFMEGVGTSLGELFAKLFLAGEAVSNWLTGIYETVVGAAVKFLEAATSIGTAIWTGLKDGIMGGVTYVMDAVSNLGDAVVGKLKGILGIHSPSSVFADMGKMSGEGYLQGLDGSIGKMTDSVPAGAFAAPAGGVASGPIQVTVNITTNVGGAGAGAGGEAAGEQIGEQVAKHVESILPSALASAFERMQQEAGA